MNIYRVAADLEEKGQRAVLCAIIGSAGSTPRRVGSKMIVFPDGKIIGTVGGGEIESRVIAEALDALNKNITKRLSYNLVDPSKGDVGVCGGTVELFVEPIIPKPVCLVVGGGHVGKAVVHLAAWLGYRVILSDDRQEFCNEDTIPGADEYLFCEMADIPKHVDLNGSTYLVLATRGSTVDVEGLPALLEGKPTYIGIIGSRRRWILTRSTLMERGIPEIDLNRIFSPLGLELNAETPEEIAVSIMAEIMQMRNGGTAKNMMYIPIEKKR
jgi:xanthine dehydrogenase accessory factor